MGRKVVIGICLFALVLGLAGYFTISHAPKVGICLQDAVDSESLSKAMRDGLVRSGYTVLLCDCDSEQKTEDTQVRHLLDKGAEILIVEILNTDTAQAILELAGDKKVIFIGKEPDELGNGCFVGTDQTAPGKVQAQKAMEQFASADINGDRRLAYMAIGGPESHAGSVIYMQGLRQALANGRYESRELKAVWSDWSLNEAKALCTEALSEFGRDLEVIFCSNSASALGALSAVLASGRQPGRDVIVVGIGSGKQVLDAIRQGTLTASVAEDPETFMQAILSTVKVLFADREVPKRNYVDYVVLTAENVEQYAS